MHRTHLIVSYIFTHVLIASLSHSSKNYDSLFSLFSLCFFPQSLQYYLHRLSLRSFCFQFKNCLPCLFRLPLLLPWPSSLLFLHITQNIFLHFMSLHFAQTHAALSTLQMCSNSLPQSPSHFIPTPNLFFNETG